MIDITDLIPERGGDPKKVKESQRKRFASEELVDEVVALFTKARASAWSHSLYVFSSMLSEEGGYLVVC